LKLRPAPWLGLAAALALVLSGAPALATSRGAPHSPLTSAQWTFGPSSPFAGTRFDGEYDPATNRVYFLGFRTTADATDGSVWYFDAGTHTYTDTGVVMPVPVSNYQIAALTDARGLGFYIFGGRDASANIVTTVQVYYPALNHAAVIWSDPWPGTTPSGCISLPAMGVAVVANTAIVMGGLSFAANGCVDDQSAQTWVFHPDAHNGSRWTQGPDLNVARGYITPVVLGKNVYAIGGDVNSGGTLIAQQTVEAWMPPTGGWDDVGVADLPEPCDESQAFGLGTGLSNRTIILAGCGQWPSAVPDVLLYDGAGNTWSVVATLNDNRRNQAGASIPFGNQTRMFILGGYGEASGFIDPIQTSEIGKGIQGSGPRPISTPTTITGGGVPTT
jgi:hypothetical protein